MFAKDLGIDLGTANTLVYAKGRGIFLNEPSVVALNKETNEVVAAGNRAKDMLGRTPGKIVAIRPLKDGVIADYTTTSAMLREFIKKAKSGLFSSKPRVIICVPLGVTGVEKRAVEDAGLQSGAREVYLVEEPMAAAIGANLPIAEPTGTMVVDIGGGTSEIAVISLGGIVNATSLRVAGDRFDEAIVSYVRKNFNLVTGDLTAEAIKMSIGCVSPFDEATEMTEMSGRDLVSGLPKTISISAAEVREALKEPVEEIVEGIKQTLENTPPELSADIMDRGIYLAGGGALLRGLDEAISREVSLPVHIAEDPLNCVIRGIGKIIDDMDHLKAVLSSTRMR